MARLVLAGIGDLNSRVAQKWQQQFGEVIAMRRSQPDSSLDIEQVQVDLSTQSWPDLAADYLIIALSAKTRTLDGYQQAYLEPILKLKDSVGTWHKLPKKIIVVSSSRVFSEQHGERINDSSEANSDDPYAKILIEMERQLHQINTVTCTATLSGIYSRDRDWFKRMARNADQETPKSNHWTNRIHINDAAAALVYLLNLDSIPERVIVSDKKPLPFCQVLNYLREQEGLPVLLEVPDIQGGKRLESKFLQTSGFQWQYPTAFSGGYSH
jgi:nucleoside-diphosphate-sugar epimerase